MPPAKSSGTDPKKLALVVAAIACVGFAAWMLYNTYGPSTPPPLPPPKTPEEAKPIEPPPTIPGKPPARPG